MCKGCLLPIAFEIKKASNKVEEEAVKNFVKEMERKDPRGMKLKDYFIHEFKDEKLLLNHSLEPWVVGHLVLQPAEHVKQLHETSDKWNDDDAEELILIVRKVSKSLEECLTSQNYPPKRIYLCSFNEASDWHLHFHIVPRAKQEVIVGPRLLTDSRREITRKEVETVVKCLREKLCEH